MSEMPQDFITLDLDLPEDPSPEQQRLARKRVGQQRLDPSIEFQILDMLDLM